MEREIFSNPMTTERMEVLVSPEENGGALLELRFSIGPHSRIAGAHVHPNLVQSFRVESGALHVRVGKETVVLRKGDSLSVPPGVYHDLWNEGDEEFVGIEETRPAQRLLEVLRVVFAFARAGKTDARGRLGLLASAALFTEYAETVRAGSRVVQWGLMRLAPLSALLGYRDQVRELAKRG